MKAIYSSQYKRHSFQNLPKKADATWCWNSYTVHAVVWRNGSMLVSINEVNLRRARLVLGWLTVSGFNSSWCRTCFSVCNQPHRPTQPSIPPGSVNEVLRLGMKKHVWFIPNCEIPLERLSYPSALVVCSRRDAIRIQVRLVNETRT